MMSWLRRCNRLKEIIFLLCLTILSGCSLSPKKTLIDVNQSIPLSQVSHWQLNARIAITTPEDSVTASLSWEKNADLFDFLISGAFGTTYAHLTQEKDQARLIIPDSEPLTHQNADFLLQQTLGWEFPISALSYWVKGLPSGHPREEIIYNEAGSIILIKLDLWTIELSKHKRFQGYLMPKMVKVNHPNVKMKLVAKKWLFYQS